jgi:hypothetical protein
MSTIRRLASEIEEGLRAAHLTTYQFLITGQMR